ncbi:vacuolar sorting protein Vps33 [Schizosaccharomyces cryophilus OY26]|uniref:Vacuolar sorting protein Vps33 n=1 Tax=Schizosaccharomyces cryophilus (strain OY26 / ATCC MYA-4695 / CBS 11777 / NBRC 106824 / NRRL Y48691) TaxID=653667 RepID=S9X9U7_SCHCR|nr:vacuolar sorting protein Vps33 [Schizosaccharomyces cryophilus OY26]EPY53917.1 vacuolar sorting protein Vps33 [Schizosaccharomyces cryophilus OY26]
MSKDAKESARFYLLDLIDSIAGKKSLLLERELSGILGQVITTNTLQEHGIPQVFWFDKNIPQELDQKVIYLCRPTYENARLVSAHVRQHQRNMNQTENTVILLPDTNVLFETVLQEEGVFGELVIMEWSLHMVPLDEDLLSLELKPGAKEDSLLKSSVRALVNFESHNGRFPRASGRGSNSAKLIEIWDKWYQEEAINNARKDEVDFSTSYDSVLIMDRTMDWVTPFLTQLTYFGLLDEVLGIDQMNVKLPPNLVSRNENSSSGTHKKFSLSSSYSTITKDVKDVNFNCIGSYLGKIARKLSSDYEGRRQAKTVNQIRDFVSKLGSLQSEHTSLNIHTGLAELMMQHAKSSTFQKILQIQQSLVSGAEPSSQFPLLDQLIYTDVPVEEVFRILCLASIVSTGLKQRDIDYYRKEIVQTYGYKNLLTFQRLIDVGLLRVRPSSNISLQRSFSYTTWLNSYPLINEEVDEQHPSDISYTYSGYGPLSVHMSYDILQNRDNPEKLRELKNLPGEYVDRWFKQQDKNVTRTFTRGTDKKRKILVFFLGGCTFTELSAFRLLADKFENFEFTFMTTGMITGGKVVQSFMPPIQTLIDE